jgi:hypothetical protein
VHIVIPDKYTTISMGAFEGRDDIQSVVIPASVTDIGDNAFADCGAMTYISVHPDNPEYSSEDGVLFNKAKTELISYPPSKADITYIIPDTVTEIGEKAFEGNAILTGVTIPGSVTKIWNKAFRKCKGLTYVTIPAGIERIGQGAFDHCESLTHIGIDENNPYLSSENKVLFNKDKTVLIEYFRRNTEEHYVIPSSVTAIDWFAFAGCDSLTGITIPESVTSIGWHAFEGCDGLTGIVLPKGLTMIGRALFCGCDNLESIVIPDGVTEIMDTAFTRCVNLKSISIPDSVTTIFAGRQLDWHPFYGCKSLTNATYKGKTYSALRMVAGRPYYDLPWEFYDNFNQPAPNPNTISVTINVDGGEDSYNS